MVASIGTLLFVGLYGDIGATVSTVVVTIVVLIFGEITPKTLANDQAETFCMRAAPALRVCLVILTPLHLFFSLFQKAAIRLFRSSEEEGITEEELITMVEEAENEGGLEHHESELIRAAIEFNDMEVEDILTPRVDIVAAPDTITMEEFAVLFAENGYSRIPVYHGSIDNIIGVVHEKDFFSARYHNHTDVISLVSKVFYTTGSTKISDLLRLLQLRKTHMAVVVDEYGGTMGIVTMEDILEELVGEIWDEHDEVEEHFEKLDENAYRVDCSASLEDFMEFFDVKLESDSISVGGWVMEQLNHVPVRGESFSACHLEITVSEVSAYRVSFITVRQCEPGETYTE
jgi:CBS domain containing-hemolysin-like protein